MYSLYWLRRSRTSSFRRSSTSNSSVITSAIFSTTNWGFAVSIVPGVRLLTSCREMYATNSLASSILYGRYGSLSRQRLPIRASAHLSRTQAAGHHLPGVVQRDLVDWQIALPYHVGAIL